MKKILSFALAFIVLISVISLDTIIVMSIDSNRVIDATLVIIGYNEGNYSSVNSNDNGALSIGKLQWHGGRALSLMRSIINEMGASSAQSILGSTLYNEIVSSSTSWASRTLSSSERSTFVTFLSTAASKTVQDSLARNDVADYVNHGISRGITSDSALVYYCDIENQYGAGSQSNNNGAWRLVNSVKQALGKDTIDSLDEFHTTLLQVTSNYHSRRTNTYNYCVSLGWDDPIPTPTGELNPGLERLSIASYAMCYTNTSGRYNVYTSSALSTRGYEGTASSSAWTGEDDEIWIIGVGINSSGTAYARIKYPVGSDRYTAYVSLHDTLVPGDLKAEPRSADKTTYGLSNRPGEATNSSYQIDPGDTIYLLSQQGGYSQILYPAAGVWRIAWCSDSTYDSMFTHTHSFTTFAYQEEAHPHYNCYKCSCGEVWRSTETNYVASCTTCNGSINPAEPDENNELFNQMLSRAEAIVNYEWTPSQRIAVWNENPYNGRMYFEAGETVKGMPYSLFYNEFGVDSLLSLEQYKRVADINYSATKYCISVNDMRTGPVYGSCCATFVSEVFGGGFMSGENPRYDNVGGIQDSPYGTTFTNATVDQIKPGDALSNTNGGHIVWVGEITDTEITIYEQTPPIARKRTVSKSSVTSEGYLICGYKDNGNPDIYNVITRVNDLMDTDSKYPTPLKGYPCVTNDFEVKKADYSTRAGVIYTADYCTINAVFADGWCHVTFPVTGTNGTLSGYTPISNFIFDVNYIIKEFHTDSQINVYTRKDLAEYRSWWIGAGDTFYVVSESDGASQVIYPIAEQYGGGYKLGWIPTSSLPVTTHCVTYDANGGEGAPEKQVTPCIISSSIPRKSGFTFKGWSTTKAGEGIIYNPGEYFAQDVDITLYAVWEEDVIISVTPGDLDGDSRITSDDAIYLLFHTFFADEYPINQDCDFNGDGAVTSDDAIYLLFHTFFEDEYPLNNK